MNLQNQSLLLNIVLAIVVVVLSVRLASNKSTTEKSVEANQSVNAEQTVLDNIATRTSIRDYEARPVEQTKVDKMLRAAMAAPTAMNKQPWHFVVVNQRSVLDALSEANPNAKMLKKAPQEVKLFLHYFQQSLSQVFTSSKPQLLAYMYTYRAYVVGVFV